MASNGGEIGFLTPWPVFSSTCDEIRPATATEVQIALKANGNENEKSNIHGLQRNLQG